MRNEAGGGIVEGGSPTRSASCAIVAVVGNLDRRIIVVLALGTLLCVVFLTISWVLPTLMERTVIQKSNVTIPQYCSYSQPLLVTFSRGTLKSLSSKEGETATLQARVVLLSSIRSLYIWVEGG